MKSRFRDIKSAQYSIHQIALMGESVDRFRTQSTYIPPWENSEILREKKQVNFQEAGRYLVWAEYSRSGAEEALLV